MEILRSALCLAVVTFAADLAAFGAAYPRRSNSPRAVGGKRLLSSVRAYRYSPLSPASLEIGERRFGHGVASVTAYHGAEKSHVRSGSISRSERRKSRRKMRRRERRRHSAARRKLQQRTEIANSTILNAPAFGFPSTSGDTITVFPLPIITKDANHRNVISFDTSDVTAADANVRLRFAEIYVQFVVEGAFQPMTSSSRRHGRINRTRVTDFRRDVTILAFLLRAPDGRTVVATAKHWTDEQLSDQESGVNRSGRLRSSHVIKRYVFNITGLGKATASSQNRRIDANLTEGRRGDRELPTLASWAIPDLHMSVLCQRRRAFVSCARNGVTLYGAPYLVLTTDAGSRGIRMRR